MHNLIAPATNMFYNAEVSARRFPNKPFLVYYDTKVSFAEFHNEAERIAGYLEQRCGVRKGDRVLLLMQNSPQFMIGYYGILRANAVVVPLNPMNLSAEILRYAQDAGASYHRETFYVWLYPAEVARPRIAQSFFYGDGTLTAAVPPR